MDWVLLLSSGTGQNQGHELVSPGQEVLVVKHKIEVLRVSGSPGCGLVAG